MSNRVYKTNTASTTASSTVHEYICLFTHDLKRKTKRWQDGRLRYHAFNSRIMVYDDRGSLVGDAHVPAQPEEGDEVNLDRGGAIVQVCEVTGQKHVDLESLVDKRAREVEKRRKEASEKRQRLEARRPQTQQPRPRPDSQQIERPLRALMQTPGPIGRASIPMESPYEQRMRQLQRSDHQGDGTPPRKRAKKSESPPSKTSHARSLFGTQLNLGAPTISRVQRFQVLRERTNIHVRQVERPKEKDNEKEVVDIGEPGACGEIHGKGTRSGDGDDDPNVEVPASSTRQRLGGIRNQRADRPRRPEPSSPRQSESTSEENPRNATTSPVVDIKPVVRAAKPVLATSLPQTHKRQRGGDGAEGKNCEPSEKSSQMSPAKVPSINTASTQLSCANEPTRDSVADTMTVEEVQPRTELRIRARKKRGLLMLMEDPVTLVAPSVPISDEIRDGEMAHKVSSRQWTPQKEYPPRKQTAQATTPPGETEDEDFEKWYAQSLAIPDSVDKAHDDGVPPSGWSPSYAEGSKTASREAQHDVPEIPEEGTRSIQQLTAVSAGDTDKHSSPAPTTAEVGMTHDTREDKPDSPQDLRPGEENDQAMQMPGNGDESSSNTSGPKARRKPRRSSAQGMIAPPATIPDFASDSSASDNDWLGPNPSPKPQKKTRSKPAKGKAKPSTGDTTKTNSAPRISRISRSSKSKEIFGFQLPGAATMNHGAAISAYGGGIGWGDAMAEAVTSHAPEMETLGIQEPKGEVDQAEIQKSGIINGDVHDGNSEESETRPRISNPATRGKKAATKAHAAGKIPETVVPLNDPIVEQRPAPEAAADSAQPVRPNVQEDCPGFTKANGGAWSRHAYDLLGMRRPNGRT